MKSEIKKYTIEETCDLITGFPFKGEKYSSEGIRVLRGENITIGALRWDTIKCWNEKFDEFEKYSLKAGDIVIGMDGSRVGKNRAQIKDSDTPLLLAQRVARLRAKPNFSQDFIYYIIKSDAFEKYVETIKTGTTIPHISNDQIKAFDFFAPDKNKQIRIAAILSALDNKIDVNNQINDTLHAIAHLIFKEWFIKFRFQQNSISMKETELGQIPSNWEIISLYDTAFFLNGSAFKESDFTPDNSGLPIIKIIELKNGITNQTRFSNKVYDPKILIESGDILFSWSGSPDTSIDTFVWPGNKALLNQHIFKIITKEKYEKYFLYYLMKHLKPIFIEIARDKQTTGLGHVTVQDMKRMKIIFPHQKQLIMFAEKIGPLFELTLSNLMQNQFLIQIRNVLSSKLMIGEIKI